MCFSLRINSSEETHPYLENIRGWHIVIIENAIEGAIHTIIDVVHIGEVLPLSFTTVFSLETLADHVHSNGVS